MHGVPAFSHDLQNGSPPSHCHWCMLALVNAHARSFFIGHLTLCLRFLQRRQASATLDFLAGSDGMGFGGLSVAL